LALSCAENPASLCWESGGETTGFGGYELGKEIECCGDDVSEYYQISDSAGSSGDPEHVEEVDMDNTDACCNNQNDCIYQNLCYETRSNTAASNAYIVTDPAWGETGGFCAWNLWYDCDDSEFSCGLCDKFGSDFSVQFTKTLCEPAPIILTRNCLSGNYDGDPLSETSECWALTGEQLIPFGEYTPGATGCCGDDSGESWSYLMYEDDFGQTQEDRSDSACCNYATDCVFQGLCYDDKNKPLYDFTPYADINSDGVVESCIEGIWYDNTTESSCVCEMSGFIYDYDDEWDMDGENNYDSGISTPIMPVGMCCGNDWLIGEGLWLMYDHNSALWDSGDSTTCCNDITNCADDGLCFTYYADGSCDVGGDDNDGDTCREIGEGPEDSGIETFDNEICGLDNNWREQDEDQAYCDEIGRDGEGELRPSQAYQGND